MTSRSSSSGSSSSGGISVSQCKPYDFGAHGLTILHGRMKDRGARVDAAKLSPQTNGQVRNSTGGWKHVQSWGASHRSEFRLLRLPDLRIQFKNQKKIGGIQNEVLYKFTRSSLGSLVDVPVLPAEAVWNIPNQLECSKNQKSGEQGVFAVFSRLLDKHFTSS